MARGSRSPLDPWVCGSRRPTFRIMPILPRAFPVVAGLLVVAVTAMAGVVAARPPVVQPELESPVPSGSKRAQPRPLVAGEARSYLGRSVIPPSAGAVDGPVGSEGVAAQGTVSGRSRAPRAPGSTPGDAATGLARPPGSSTATLPRPVGPFTARPSSSPPLDPAPPDVPSATTSSDPGPSEPTSGHPDPPIGTTTEASTGTTGTTGGGGATTSAE